MFTIWLLTLSLTASEPSSVDLSALSGQQRDVFQDVAKNEFCGCASALTLAGCLALRPTCRLSADVGDILRRAVQTGAPKTPLANFLSKDVMGPYCSVVRNFKLDGAAREGNPKAPVTVLEFADFRCGHCRHAVPLVHKAIDSYKDKAQLIYVPVALQDAEPSLLAAEAAMAANAQGKFWPMHAALFAREEGDFTLETLRQIAKKVGLSMPQFDKDMLAHSYRELLSGLKKQAVDAGLVGTPMFFVNGRQFNMQPDIFTLEHRIQMELDRDKGNCK
jgi:protein-disulfide isomerase